MGEFTFHCKRMIHRSLSFLPFFVIIAICYFTEEFYPLSSFPMYSKFDDRTYITYLRDAEGNELPTVATVNMYASQLKKRYGDELADLKKDHKGSHFDWDTSIKSKAGEDTLEWLKTEHKAVLADGIEIVDLRIFLRDGKIVREESVVGKVD